MLGRIALFLSFIAAVGVSRATDVTPRWVEGKNYAVIPNSHPSAKSGPVVVTEVFSFACPYCNDLEPYMDQLRSKLPKGVELRYVPAAFIPSEDWLVFQRAYLTAVALGLDTPTSRDDMYKAIWGPDGGLATFDSTTRQAKSMDKMPTIEDTAKFYSKFGANATQFTRTAKSPQIDAAMKHANKQIAAWGVTGTPTIIVDGKWVTDVPSAEGEQQLVDLTLYLTNKALASKQVK